jgi:hypothetical protein
MNARLDSFGLNQTIEHQAMFCAESLRKRCTEKALVLLEQRAKLSLTLLSKIRNKAILPIANLILASSNPGKFKMGLGFTLKKSREDFL